MESDICSEKASLLEGKTLAQLGICLLHNWSVLRPNISLIEWFYCHQPMKLREGNVFSRGCLSIHWGEKSLSVQDHGSIPHTWLHHCVQCLPCFWHLMTGDLFKLFNSNRLMNETWALINSQNPKVVTSCGKLFNLRTPTSSDIRWLKHVQRVSGWFASYWNAFLLQYSNFGFAINSVWSVQSFWHGLIYY